MRYLPLYCFPPASWLAESMTEDVILDVHEYYEKQTLRNRIEILGVNGSQVLTIPVIGQKGQKVMTKDIRISGSDWKKMHLTSIRSAYGRAPYFDFYFDELSDIFLKQYNFLVDFNLEAISWLRGNGLQICERLSMEFIPYTEKEIVQTNSKQSAPSYLQVFSDRLPFATDLSVIDLIMNLGPRTADYILLWKNGK